MCSHRHLWFSPLWCWSSFNRFYSCAVVGCLLIVCWRYIRHGQPVSPAIWSPIIQLILSSPIPTYPRSRLLMGPCLWPCIEQSNAVICFRIHCWKWLCLCDSPALSASDQFSLNLVPFIVQTMYTNNRKINYFISFFISSVFCQPTFGLHTVAGIPRSMFSYCTFGPSMSNDIRHSIIQLLVILQSVWHTWSFYVWSFYQLDLITLNDIRYLVIQSF